MRIANPFSFLRSLGCSRCDRRRRDAAIAVVVRQRSCQDYTFVKNRQPFWHGDAKSTQVKSGVKDWFECARQQRIVIAMSGSVIFMPEGEAVVLQEMMR